MKDRKQRDFGLASDSRGMASILITLVTMIVVTLIVLGFAQIARREQGNTLDNQLSTQAFYAAETAVNDARNVIDNAVQDDATVPAKTQCNQDPTGTYPIPDPGDSGVILNSTTNDNVSYTCLLVNPTPSTMEKDGVEDNSWVVPVSQGDPMQPFDTVEIQWAPDPAVTSGSPGADCPATLDTLGQATGANPAKTYNCKFGILRFDLVPTDGSLTGGSGAGSLLSEQLTAFVQPLNTSAGPNTSIPYAASVGQANVVKAICTASYNHCTAYITGLSAASYTLRINSLYSTSDVTVQALHGGTSGNAVPLNGQVLVDATGDADGVLRRIQVRFSAYGNTGLEPRYALQSNSAICKRFFVTPTYYANGDNLSYQSNTADPNYNAMCDPSITDGSP